MVVVAGEDRITEHFSWDEFACHDGTPVPDDLKDNVRRLCKNLEALRVEIGKPIRILSGYRTADYNASRPGTAKTSQHIHGRAADIAIRDMTPSEVRKVIIRLILRGKMEDGGIGLYDGFLHYDVRGFHARWDDRTTAEV